MRSSFTALAFPLLAQAALPVVNLDYIQQEALSLTDGYYTFSNIPFAQPPLGDLRFTAPVAPKKVNGIHNGNITAPVCPQASPPWLPGFFGGPPSPRDTSNTEDCLYLDVLVPKAVFDHGKGPVLNLIYGGGLVIGSKDTNNPRGLVVRAMQNTSSDGMIVVAANYRVGNFGTLGGSDFEAQGGTSNVALLDQRMVIDWIQKYIHLFGGDCSQVTLMGESGGASSIAHQITAAPALGGFAFKQVIMQSPAEITPSPNDVANKLFNTFLKAANVSTLAEARKLDSAVLQEANYNLAQKFPQGVFPYTYTIDNRIVKVSARKSLLKQCAPLKGMISHNLNEGALFAPTTDNTTFIQYVKQWIPGAQQNQLNTIDSLYPASSFPNVSKRIEAFIGEALINCNSAAYHRGFDNQAFSYRFGEPAGPFPAGYHIQDLDYTYYTGTSDRVNPEVAFDMQTRFANFVVHGDANAAKPANAMPRYGSNHKELDYAASGLGIAVDEYAMGVNQRCQFWNSL